jgi:hypothetical protein
MLREDIIHDVVVIPGHVLNNKKTKIGIDVNELKDE